MKTDNILLAHVFEKFKEVSIEEYRIHPLYCVSICSYTHQCGLKHTNNKLQT